MMEERELREDARAARLLANLPDSAPAACQRVRNRVLKGPATTSRELPLARGLRLIAVGASLGAAAAALLLFARANIEEPGGAAPVALATTLDAGQGWGIHTAIPNVALSFAGSGTIEGTSDAPRIAWDGGLLNVEVAPDKGIRLAVTTREAEVRVVGTGFTVTRDQLGTRVDVRHGKVEVDCGSEATRALTAGDGVTCLPRSAAGLLGRARALQAEGAPAADALDALDRGLAIVGPNPSVKDELTTRRIRALYDLSRHGEALDAARAYLAAGGGVRPADVVQLAVASATALGGCETAAPWLLEQGPAATAACSGQ